MDLFKQVAYKYMDLKPEEYKIIQTDLNSIRSKIRNKDYSALNLSCYLCDDPNHISINCYKLKNFDEFVKLNFRNKKMSIKEKKALFETINKNDRRSQGSIKNSRRASANITKLSLPSFSKNTHDDFFSYREDENEQDSNISSFEAFKNNNNGLSIHEVVMIANEKYSEDDILKINKF